MAEGDSPRPRRDDDEPLPIKLGPVSNGEFHPVPHSPVVREAVRRTYRLAEENSRRLGISRRTFLNSSMGAEATLYMLSACSKDVQASTGTNKGRTSHET